MTWSHERLKDVATINRQALPASTDPDYEFSYLEISNVDYFGVVSEEGIERLRFEDAPSRARRVVAANSTVISSVRPNLQAVAYFPDAAADFICSTGFNVVESDGKCLFPAFAYYCLISDRARQHYESVATGVGYPAVSDKEFGQLTLPIPPADEQKRIAAYLDASCRAIDAAVAAKREQIETLSELKRRTLHEVFDNPQWQRERIKDVTIKIGSGVTPDGGASSYLDSGVPLLRSQNVHFEGLRLEDVAYISSETHEEMSNSQVKPLDVLVNITGASIGRCAYVPEGFGEANVNQHVCILRPSHKIDSRFLALYLASPLGQGDIFSGFTGASRQGLSHTDLGLFSVPLPSIFDQRETMVRTGATLARLSDSSETISNQIETLTAYRKSLIHECVTGQRRITDEDVNRVTAHASSLA